MPTPHENLSSTLKMEPICSSETSERNHQYVMLNDPEELSFQPLHIGSLKSLMGPFSEKYFEVYQIEMMG